MTSNETVTVFGAYGHTGRFVVSELRYRGWTPILSGRDPDKLNALGNVYPGLDLRPTGCPLPRIKNERIGMGHWNGVDAQLRKARPDSKVR